MIDIISKIFFAVSVVSMLSGLILLFWTAEASDLNLIDFKTIVSLEIIGIVLMIIGCIGLTCK